MTKFQKILPTIAAAVLLRFFLNPVYWAIVGLVLLSATLFERWRFRILMAATVLFWFDTGLLNSERANPNIPAWNSPLRFLAVICVLLLLYLIFSLRKYLKYPVLTLLLMHAAVFTLCSLPYANPDFRMFMLLMLVYFKAFFWFLVLLILDPGPFPKWNCLFIWPFWSHFFNPIPSAASPNILMAADAKDEAQLTATRWSAVRLLAIGIVVLYSRRVLERLIFESPNWTWLPSLGIPRMIADFSVITAQQAALPVWERWLALIAHVTLRYMHLGIGFAAVIGIGRAAGFRLIAMMNSPWLASSFGDLFGRLLYHYNRLLMKVFYPRFKESLGFIRSSQKRVYTALFLSITIGGVITHFPRDGKVDYFNGGLSSSVLNYLNALPYFTVLAFAVSITLYYRDKSFKPPLAWRIVRPVIYFVFFSLIYSLYMAGVHNRGTWNSYFIYLLSLVDLT